MFAVLNIETGDFYSESPSLKMEAKLAGSPWNHLSILPEFARPYVRYKDALRRSQHLSNTSGCICAVVHLETCQEATA